MIKNYSTYIKESIKNFDIKKIYDGVKENYDYDEEDEEDEDWKEDDLMSKVPQDKIVRGIKVMCIKDCNNILGNINSPIKAGEIKTIKNYGTEENIWFDDTPDGKGSYKKEYFVKI